MTNEVIESRIKAAFTGSGVSAIDISHHVKVGVVLPQGRLDWDRITAAVRQLKEENPGFEFSFHVTETPD